MLQFRYRNLLLAACLGLSACAVSPPPLATSQVPPPPQAPFQAGPDYRALPGKVQTLSGERIEVVEFFMYTCEHCSVFEPILRAWENQLPADVVLKRIPIPLGDIGTRYARVFYTAQALDVLPKIHAATFDSFHRRKQFLQNDDAVRAFFVANGVDAAAFDRTYSSTKITSKITHGSLLSQLYGVTTVPSLGVNGRYWIDTRQARTYQRALEISDYLINSVR